MSKWRLSIPHLPAGWPRGTTRVVWLVISVGVLLMWQLTGLPLLKAPGSSNKAAALTWYDNGYQYRKAITQDFTKVSGGSNLTNFPMLLSVTDANLKTAANGGHVQNSNGYDIIFTASDGTTKLDHEVESYNGSTGQLIAWVRIPTLSASANTVIYIYYGNSSISSSQANPTGVWSANYAAVWHMDETGNATAGEYVDSTSHANNGQGGDGTATKVPTVTGGIVGNAQNFSGSQFIYVPTATGFPAINSTSQTVSLWFKVASIPSATQDFLSIIQSGGGAADQIQYRGSNIYLAGWSGDLILSTASPAAGAWHMLTWTNSGGTNTIYIDGVSKATNTTGLQVGTAGYAIFSGYNTTPGEPLVGQMDETEVSSVALSAGWIATTYNNQNSPSTFVSYGSEQQVLVSQYDYRWVANANNAQGGSALAAKNTAASVIPGSQFRLRMLLHVSGGLLLSGKQFKLQVVDKGTGTCASPSGGTPASYTDVTTSSAVAYYNNSSVSSPTNLTANANDPTHTGDTVIDQQYQEANNFTDGTAPISDGQDGLWDFSLVDNGPYALKSYCFRAVNSDGTTLSSYTQYPEVDIVPNGTLSVDIVNGSGVSVASPSFALSSTASAFGCASSSSTLGTSTQNIRVQNGTGDPSWALSLAATAGSTALWSSGSAVYDFNDPSGSPSGCAAGADSDTYAGLLSLSFGSAALTAKSGCTTTGLNIGSNAYFNEGTTNSVLLLSAGSNALMGCYWTLDNIGLTQRIPAAQPAGNYRLNLTLTVVAD